MGRQKKGFNWKARDQPTGEVDQEEVEKLRDKVHIEGLRTDSGYEGSNALALPATKLKFNKHKPDAAVGRILSKKQRKRLEHIVDSKQKKGDRAQLLEKLGQVQVDQKTLSALESLSSVQTKGVKRQMIESQELSVLMQTEGIEPHVANVQLVNKKRKLKNQTQDRTAAFANRDDVLGFDESSSDESDEEDAKDIPESAGNSNSEEKVSSNLENQSDEHDDTSKQNDISDKITESDFKVNKKKSPEETPVKIPINSHKPDNIKYVHVNRSAEIEKEREKLPIIAEEQVIMETINNHQVTVLAGETGSGKTTQVPQFLYEAGYAMEKMIGVTEPRRVAAMAMSSRVATEMNLDASVVSFQIRFQGNVTEDTKIKFMTDGVLLREIEKDFLLSKYSVIIIDEAHERSVFTDILIGLLSRIVPLRHKKGDPLKLVIMSATLRVEDFTINSKLFKTPPPVIKVDARQFPVTVHSNKRTPGDDYVGEAFRKVCKIHRQLPEGGILVFVTGQAEVNILIRKLRSLFPSSGQNNVCDEDVESKLDEALNALNVSKHTKETDSRRRLTLPEINLEKYNIQPPDDAEDEHFVNDDEDDDLPDLPEDNDEVTTSGGVTQPLHVLPLYSLLSTEKQNRIFSPPPPGTRLCVVATNVAETSLTIPGIKYVVDTGKVKTKFYDKVTGVSTFLVTWTSRAGANQRAGRSGRQGPGHCYRLYSSAVFNNDLEEFSKPEIQMRPVDDLLLTMKAMNIDKVVNFPFPTSPDVVQLRTAEKRLQILGALESPAPDLPLRELQKLEFTSKVTPLGRAIATFPLSPRFGKMLALSHQHDLLPLAIALVAALTVQEVLVERGIGSTDSQVPGKLMQLRRKWAGQGACLSLGDPMVLLKAVLAAEANGYTPEWCEEAGIRFKAMMEIRRLRRQLSQEVELILPGVIINRAEEPSQTQARLLGQLLLAGCPDQVARKIPEGEAGYDAKKPGYHAGSMEQPVYLHRSSVLRKVAPEWVIYQELFETDKVYLRGVTQIQPEWLPVYCPSICNLGKPAEDPPPRYCTDTGRLVASIAGTFGPAGWPLPRTELELPQGVERFKWLARFLLDGNVAPTLKQFASSLLSSPIVMVKPWSNLQPRTELLLKELCSENVDDGKKLQKVWTTNPSFLKKSYCSWLPQALHEDVEKIWPPEVP